MLPGCRFAQRIAEEAGAPMKSDAGKIRAIDPASPPKERLLGAGADAVGDATQAHMVAIDARAPLYDGGICTRIDCVSLGVVLNREARRFYDEGEDFWPKRYAIWGRLVALQPGHSLSGTAPRRSRRRSAPCRPYSRARSSTKPFTWISWPCSMRFSPRCARRA